MCRKLMKLVLNNEHCVQEWISYWFHKIEIGQQIEIELFHS